MATPRLRSRVPTPSLHKENRGRRRQRYLPAAYGPGCRPLLRSAESLNRYTELTAQGLGPEEALAAVLPGARDHARVPVRWEPESSRAGGGVTDGARGSPPPRTPPRRTRGSSRSASHRGPSAVPARPAGSAKRRYCSGQPRRGGGRWRRTRWSSPGAELTLLRTDDASSAAGAR